MDPYNPRQSAGLKRYSREGFQRLTGPSSGNDATISIPMQHVQPNSGPTTPMNEKAGLFNRGSGGFRRSFRPGESGTLRHHAVYDGDDDGALNKLGEAYHRFLNFSIFTRYLVYVLPPAILIAIPIIVGATVAQDATIGDVRIVWFFAWILTSWAGLWASKVVAHYLPRIFQGICGIVSPGTRKYASALRALEIPVSLCGWGLVSLATFKPVMTRNPTNRAKGFPDNKTPQWITIVQEVLAAAFCASIIYLIEKLVIQYISITYHRRQYNERIKESKRNVYLLGLLYEASRTMFPMDCPEFIEEDAVIANTIDFSKLGHRRRNRKSAYRSGAATPLRMMRELGQFGNKLTSALGNVAHEVTGKDMFNANSSHSIVVEALEKNRSAEALARRIWLSFVIEGNEALFLEDIVEVLGAGRQAEAEEAFSALDRDANGDVSLDEMILAVTEYGRDRHAIANSMHDVDQAISVLDGLLLFVVFVAVVFIFIAFLNRSFVTTLATAGTALLSLSFVFSVTAQEVLGSCIFLFVKHPFDIGDRVDVNKEPLVVEHISLLFTAFRRVTNHQMVQIPNIVLNTLWIENISRSKAQREQVSAFIDFSTSFEDIQTLKAELVKFVLAPENSRDFQPDIDIQVLSIAEMNKLELQINVLHKSNWSNETVRAARRSKLMCALIAAIRRVPINAPGGGGPSLGDPSNPSYSVAITNDEAVHNKVELAEKKEAARLVPIKKNEPTWIDQLAPHHEQKAMNALNDRSPALDGGRDDDAYDTMSRAGGDIERAELDDGELRRAKSTGRRKSGRTHSTKSIGASTIASLHRGSYPEMPRIGISAPEVPALPTTPTRPLRPDERSISPRPAASINEQPTQHVRDESYESLHAVPPPPPPPPAELGLGRQQQQRW